MAYCCACQYSLFACTQIQSYCVFLLVWFLPFFFFFFSSYSSSSSSSFLSHSLPFSILWQLCSPFLVSCITWLKNLVLIHSTSLFPLKFNSNSPKTVILYTLSTQPKTVIISLVILLMNSNFFWFQ